MFMHVASFPDSPTGLLSEFGHSISHVCMCIHAHAVFRTLHSLHSRSAAKGEERVFLC